MKPQTSREPSDAGIRQRPQIIGGRSINTLIERYDLNPHHVRRLRKLASLAPHIMGRIIAGDAPQSLTLVRLKKDFPIDWDAQRSHFGLSQLPH